MMKIRVVENKTLIEFTRTKIISIKYSIKQNRKNRKKYLILIIMIDTNLT